MPAPGRPSELLTPLARLLAHRGIPGTHLARVTGIHYDTIKMYLKGIRTPSSINLSLMAQALHVSEDTLADCTVRSPRRREYISR